MLSEEILNKFRNGVTVDDVGHASVAKDLLEDAISFNVTNIMPKDSKYKMTYIVYDNGYYLVIGEMKNESGGHELQFKEDLSELGFKVKTGVIYFKPIGIEDLLNACVENIKGFARTIEITICNNYLSSSPDGVRYGTEKYLDEEFANFVEWMCKEVSKGKRPIQEAYPLDFDVKGNIIEYFKQRDVEYEGKIHVI